MVNVETFRTGKQHSSERFTGFPRPQTAVSNVTSFWALETWKFQAQQARPRRAKELAPTGRGSAGTTLFSDALPLLIAGADWYYIYIVYIYIYIVYIYDYEPIKTTVSWAITVEIGG